MILFYHIYTWENLAREKLANLANHELYCLSQRYLHVMYKDIIGASLSKPHICVTSVNFVCLSVRTFVTQ